MRTIVVWCVLLSACASHDVRCDSKLRQINLPGAGISAAGAGIEVGAP